MLEIALAPVGPAVIAQGAPARLDGAQQNAANRLNELFNFRSTYLARFFRGVDPRMEQSFTCINVPNSRDNRLIEQNGFDRSVFICKFFTHRCAGEFFE